MARIPKYTRTETLPGVGQLAWPHATPNVFGAAAGRGLQETGAKISSYAKNALEKKIRDNGDVYVSKITSAARNKFTRRMIELRRTADGDISGQLNDEMNRHLHDVLATAPNNTARTRGEISLNTMFSTMRANSIVGDEEARINRKEIQFGESHANNRGSVYDSFSNLSVTLESSFNEINSLKRSNAAKRHLWLETREELGYDAISGLIDSGEIGAQQALKLLTLPNNQGTMIEIGGEEINFINREHRQALIKYANTTIRGIASDKTIKAAAAEREYKLTQRKIRNTLFEHHINATLTDQIIKDSGGDWSTKQWIRQLQVGDADRKTVPLADRSAKFISLYERAINISPEAYEDFESEVMNARMGHLINDSQFTFLLNRGMEERSQIRKNFESTLKSNINTSNYVTGQIDPKGDELYYSALIETQKLVEDARKKGVPINLLFDPTKEKTYIGNYLRSKYIRPPAKILNDILDAQTDYDPPDKVEKPVFNEIEDEIEDALGN